MKMGSHLAALGGRRPTFPGRFCGRLAQFVAPSGRPGYDLRTIPKMKFVQDILHVILHRVLANVKPVGNFFVGEGFGHQVQNFLLPRTQGAAGVRLLDSLALGSEFR